MAIDFNKTPEEIEAEAAEKTAEKAARDRAIAAIPALFIDTWHVLTFAGHARVTFGEIFGDADNFRTAIVLELDDAESLGRQLLRMAQRRKIRDAERAAVKPQEDQADKS
jgi:hypothetical protein